ncbi:MAG: serine/threonine-protein kinase, partial [Planctomycetota bacterium]
MWTVTDAHTGHRYAVKTLRPEGRSDTLVEAFRREAQTWIALGRHDHVVQALWLVDEAPGPFLVLEFVEGRNLADEVGKGPLEPARALDLALQCASGLVYAHTKRVGEGVGVVHRDIKPSNLLVTPDGRLKITDFGLARVHGGRTAGDGARAGTPAYMAPEQLQGGAVDGRTDIYAFGLVLYELVTGVNPLQADDLQEQIENVLSTVPPPLDDVPPALSALIARCIAKDPAQRPRDVAEVLAQLAQVARAPAFVEISFHVDPRTVAAPAQPTGLAVSVPALRPRRPNAGEPCTAELELRGDVGPGPVDLAWRLPPAAGLELLSPRGEARLEVAAGGSVRLKLRLHLMAEGAGRHEVGESRLAVFGPEGEATYRVPAFAVDAAFQFELPLVGRDELTSLLRAGVTAAATGRPGALFLYGELGLGKSRLLREAARLAAVAGVRVVSSRAQATGLRPLRVLHEMAREVLEVSRERGHRVRAAVNELLPDSRATARYFAEMMLGGSAIEQDTPLVHHWFVLLEAATAKEPLVLLLDDLHLADDAAIGVIRDLVARAHEAELPLLVVATADNAEQAAHARRRVRAMREDCAAARHVELQGLARADVERLLENVFPGHGFGEEAPWLEETITRTTRGNPFHIREILRVLRIEAVQRREGEWRLPADLSPGRLRELVPGALEAAVRKRLDALGVATRAVVDHAALVGEEFDTSLVKEAVGDAAAVDRALAELETAEIVRAEGNELDRYRFWSASVPTVVRRALADESPRRARVLHRAVAEAMLRVYRGGNRVRRALVIAQHLRAAGQERRSFAYTLVGCQRLLGLQLAERARRLLANAKSIASDRDVPAKHRAHYHYLYGLACESSGDYDEGLDSLTRFVESAVLLPGDPRSLPRAYVRLGRIHQARGEYDRAQYCFGVARELFEELGDLRKLAFVFVSLADLALERGQLLAAEDHIGAATRHAAETGNESAAVQALILRGRRALVLSRPAEAQTAFGAAERRALALGDRRRRASALEGLGRVALESGYLSEARAWIESAIELHAKLGDRNGLATSLLHLGDTVYRQGRVGPALDHYRRARRVFVEIGHRDGIASARYRAGRLLAAWGRTTVAIRELAAAAEEFGRLGLPDRHPALRDLAGALADAGSVRPARIALARADRGDRPERHAGRTAGHVSRIAAGVVLAEVALRDGRPEEARRAADVALAFARAQGAPFGAAAAERVLLELAGRAGRPAEALERAHRAARAYTGRSDVRDGPARLLVALGRGLRDVRPRRAQRFLQAARRCYERLEAQGFRPPESLLTASCAELAGSPASRYDPPAFMRIRPRLEGKGSVAISFSANLRYVRPVRHFISALCTLAEYDEDETES